MSVEAPIVKDSNWSRVRDLQDALRVLLERGLIVGFDKPKSPTHEELAALRGQLEVERTDSRDGRATQRLVQIVQVQQGLGDSIDGVDERTADVLNQLLGQLGEIDEKQISEFVVSGWVTYPSSNPAVGLIVRARYLSFRSDEALGRDSVTGADGHYEIRCSRPDLGRAAKGKPQFVVRVFRPDGVGDPDDPLVEVPTQNAESRTIEIDIVVPGKGLEPSEFERHVEAILPLLAGHARDGTDLPIAGLTQDDLDFLAGDTGIARQHLQWIATAFARAAQTVVPGGPIDPSKADGHAALFYGWFREGLPEEWDQLVEQPVATLRSAALAAIAHEVIPAGLESSLEANLDAMPNPRRDAVRAALTTAGLGADGVGALLQHADSLPRLDNMLVAGMVKRGELADADAHRIGLGLALHQLTDGDEATMAAIVACGPAMLGGQGLRRARDLAALATADLEQALTGAHIEPPSGMTVQNHAAAIAEQIAGSFPTEALLHRVTTVPPGLVNAIDTVIAQPPGPAIPGPSAAADAVRQLRAFVNLHPGLGLGPVIDSATDASAALDTIHERVGWIDRVRALNPDVDLLAINYLPDSGTSAQVSFEGLPDEARTMVVADLKAYQRIHSVGAGPLNGIELLKAGYRSATALAQSLPHEIGSRPNPGVNDDGRRFLQELPTQRRKDYARVCTSISH